MLNSGTETLYSNKIGITFQWQKTNNSHHKSKTINILFNNMALRFNIVELKVFLQDVEFALSKPIQCQGDTPKDCQSMFLETPLSQLSLAMSYNELLLMKDLIAGTLFKLSYRACSKK